MPSLEGFENIHYFNFNQVSLTDDTICAVEQNYNEIIMDPSVREYFLSVEKMTLPIQHLPLFPNIDRAFGFCKVNGTEQNTIDGLLTAAGSNNDKIPVSNENVTNTILKQWYSLKDIYSVGDIIDALQSANIPDPTDAANSNLPNKLKVHFTSSGQLEITNPHSATVSLVFSKHVQYLLLFNLAVVGEKTKSLYPIFNHVDCLKRIILRSYDINAQSEIDGLGHHHELTSIDMAIPYQSKLIIDNATETTTAFPDVYFNPRQDLVYTPNYPRFVRLTGVPISMINVEVYQVNLVYDQPENDVTGTLSLQTKQVLLPRGGVFNIKLAFWLKK